MSPAVRVVREAPREQARCENCGSKFTLPDSGDWYDILHPAENLSERVAPGEIMPAGECPVIGCGALCHLVPRRTTRRKSK